MDRGARDRIMNCKGGKGISALLLLALLLPQAGCRLGARGGAPPPPEPEKVADARSADGHGSPGAEEGRDAARVPDSPAPAAVLSATVLSAGEAPAASCGPSTATAG